MLTLVGGVSLGLGQPGGPGGPGGSGGTGGQSIPGVLSFEASASGTHEGTQWSVVLKGQVDHVTSADYISGGKNHVRVVDFVPSSSPAALEFEILKLEMKIGGLSVNQWAPSNPAEWKELGKYYPVRFTAAKFSHNSAVPIEIRATFKVRLSNTIGSQWSPTLEVVASTSDVIAYNVALNWQSTVNSNGQFQFVPTSYPGQAQQAGNGQRPKLAELNHKVDMPSPMGATAEAILQSYIGNSTFLVPNTHGLVNGLWDSATALVSDEDMASARNAAVAAGIPMANMAFFMACNSHRDFKATLAGSSEFVSIGTKGIIWSQGYTNGNLPVAGSNPPQHDIYNIYVQAINLMKEGYFADEVGKEAEEAAGVTVTEVLSFNADTNEGMWVPIDFTVTGMPTQRPSFVYMDLDERKYFRDSNLDTALWYLVEDPNGLRGQ